MIAVYKTLKIVLLHTQVEVSLVNLTQSRVTLGEPERGAVCIRLACGGEKACTSLWLEGPGCTGVEKASWYCRACGPWGLLPVDAVMTCFTFSSMVASPPTSL